MVTPKILQAESRVPQKPARRTAFGLGYLCVCRGEFRTTISYEPPERHPFLTSLRVHASIPREGRSTHDLTSTVTLLHVPPSSVALRPFCILFDCPSTQPRCIHLGSALGRESRESWQGSHFPFPERSPHM